MSSGLTLHCQEPCRSLSDSHQQGGHSPNSFFTCVEGASQQQQQQLLQPTQASDAAAATAGAEVAVAGYGAAAAAAGGLGAVDAGAAVAAALDDLTGPLGLGPAMEETTTPELELVGCYSQEPSTSGLKAGGGKEGPGAAVEQEFEASTRLTLFPIFRPKCKRKCLVLVRHGESSKWREKGTAC